MAVNLRKFVNPKFLRTVDPELLGRLLERHRHRLIGLDVDVIRSTPECAGEALQEFFAGPEDCYPEGLIADLHRIAELGDAAGLRLILHEARRAGLSLRPGCESARASGGRTRSTSRCGRSSTTRRCSTPPRTCWRSPRAPRLPSTQGSRRASRPTSGRRPARRSRPSCAAMLEADLCGSYCRLGWYADADDVNLVISHGSIVKTTPIVRRGEERVVSYRDAEQAVLSYSAATGRLKMRRHPEVPPRRRGRALRGRACSAGPGFFAAESAQDLYTLAPIERNRPGLPLPPWLRPRHPTGADRRGAGGRPCARRDIRQRLRCDAAAWRGTPRACALARLDEIMRGGSPRPGLAAGARRHPHRARCRPRAAGAADRQDQAPGEGRLPAASPRGPRPRPPAPKRARP